MLQNLPPTEVELNRLAQLFYEASGITLSRMTDKPMIVAGLRAVFEKFMSDEPDARHSHKCGICLGTAHEQYFSVPPAQPSRF